jgi:hypothetical protein
MDAMHVPTVAIVAEHHVRIGAVECGIGEGTDGYVLRAVLRDEQPPLAVIETLDGTLVFASEAGPQAVLEPRLEGANAQGFQAGYFERVLEAHSDLLGERVLAGGEPSYQAVVALLPRLIDYSFVGDPRVEERAIVRPDGSIEGLLGPLTKVPEVELAQCGEWGMLDWSLPLPVMRLELDEGASAEQIVVATVGAEGSLRVLVRRRYLEGDGERLEYLGLPTEGGPGNEAEFYEAVLTAWRQRRELEERLMKVEGGDSDLTASVVASLQMAELTMRGCRPRYGIGVYDQERHDGFPPTTLHLVLCLLEWGDLARAEDILGYYLDAFVNSDGSFDYYGPAVAEYGQMLALAARYVQLSGDLRWWVARQSVLRRIWQRLLDLRRRSLEDEQAPPGARGLIAGLPEADYHGDEEQWREYYFAGDAWACRGLTEMARLLQRTGQDAEASTIIREVQGYKADLAAAIAGAKVDTEGGVFVPPGPTQRTPFEHMTQDRHASYCNYRYLAEMVSAGIVDRETMRQVFDYRRSHGGELLGMTRFMGHLDDWPVLNYARAMLELGDVEHYLLLLYSHLAHHQAAGWLAAYEQVDIVPDEHGVRHQRAGQVVPCQVTVPLMLRWALAYELRDQDVLLVAPAVAHRWIAGEGGLQVSGLPTRWGRLEFELRGSDEAVEARLRLPEGFAAEVRLRIPAPLGRALRGVQVNGREAENLLRWECIVTLPPPSGEQLTVVATF